MYIVFFVFKKEFVKFYMYIFVEFVECKYYLLVMYFIVNICVLYFKVNIILYFNVGKEEGNFCCLIL